jgi:putative peptidoglycan lipid II flippase
VTTALSGGNLVVNAVVALALYKPFGVGGVVIGTVVGTLGMAAAQGWMLRRELDGIEGRATAAAVLQMLAAAGVLCAVSYSTWAALDDALGRALWAQAIAVGGAIAIGVVVYGALVLAFKVPEALQIRRLVGDRLRRR